MLTDLLNKWLSLIRPEFPLLTFFGVLLSAVVAAKTCRLEYVFYAIGPMLITAGCFALNDYFDVESDRKLGRKDRPVASGKISKREALAFSAVTIFAGLAIAFVTSTPLLSAIAFVFTVIGVLYNWRLKKTLLAGNIAVSTTYAIPFVYGNLAVGAALNQPTLLFAAIAFTTGLGRELINSVKDAPGDKKIGVLSLPMLLGGKTVATIGALLLLAATALSLAPIAHNWSVSIAYYPLVLACDALLLHAAIKAVKDQSFENLSKVRKLTIYALLLGVAAYATFAI